MATGSFTQALGSFTQSLGSLTQALGSFDGVPRPFSMAPPRFRRCAAVLGIAEGTLKSRLLAAKRALLAAAEPILPPSQRGPV